MEALPTAAAPYLSPLAPSSLVWITALRLALAVVLVLFVVALFLSLRRLRKRNAS